MNDNVSQPASESFDQLKDRLAVEQAGKSKEDVIQETGGIDLDNLPKYNHHWTQRGISVTCSGGDHPPHRHLLPHRG